MGNYLGFFRTLSEKSHPVLYRLVVRLGLLVVDELADGEVVLLHHLPLPLQVCQLHVRLIVIQSFL